MITNDPDIGSFGIVTTPIDQPSYTALLKKLQANPVVFEALVSTKNQGDWTWSLCPCEIRLRRPTVIRSVHRILRTKISSRESLIRTRIGSRESRDRISVASTNYYPPECSAEEFAQNFRTFLHTPNLPSFLRAARDEIVELEIDDPTKAVRLLYEAGLDESFINEFA